MSQNLIEHYAASFPFVPFVEEQLTRVELGVGATIPSLARFALAKVGKGNYWLTGQFFVLDLTLELTRSVKTSLLAVGSQFDKIKSEEFDFEPAPYTWTGRELVLGCSEFIEYFIDCGDTPDPLVFCHLANVGVFKERRRLSEVVRGFRYFDNPQDIPQYLIDFHWFETHIGFGDTMNMDRHHRMVRKWIAAGRSGMPMQYLGHPNADLNLELGDDSIFSPAYLS
jgi:hypothetical protein